MLTGAPAAAMCIGRARWSSMCKSPFWWSLSVAPHFGWCRIGPATPQRKRVADVAPLVPHCRSFELSISDSNGEVFSLSLADAADRDTWRDALNSRVAPPAIARASHILLKNNASRRLASWRDPDGVDIRKRSESAAAATLRGFRAQIERGEATMEELAMRHSDCDTAKFGGDLGWFGAGYMQPEFEEAVLALEVGQLSDCVVSPSGVHLILRTG